MNVDMAAKTIWEYMLLHHELKKCEVILVLCSLDDRVAGYAAELFLKGYGELLIFSGGVSHAEDLLKPRWNGTEAEHFASIALAKGVPKDKILLENKATNTGENIRFSFKLLKRNNLLPKSLLLVQKPYMERRSYATFKKQWSDTTTEVFVTSPPITYEAYFNKQNPKNDILHIMIGDLQRIRLYPSRGLQIEQPIPEIVADKYRYLIDHGYTKHLIRED